MARTTKTTQQTPQAAPGLERIIILDGREVRLTAVKPNSPSLGWSSHWFIVGLYTDGSGYACITPLCSEDEAREYLACLDANMRWL